MKMKIESDGAEAGTNTCINCKIVPS